MSVKNIIVALLNKLPYVRALYSEQLEFKKNSCYPPGHYYSPIVSIDDVKQRANEIWESELTDNINAIDINAQEQVNLVKHFEQYYNEIPFVAERNDKTRYFFGNGFYSYTDAVFLYSVIRHFKPAQIIEVGSGYSSAVMLDTNERFFDNSIKLTFIEPYTERLNTLMKKSDENSVTVIQSDVQKVSADVFKKLNAGDILFIDSTHVAKTGSDVNYLLFEILPQLKSGVLIHFHDIFYPFEYPKEWVFMGRNWNEDYFLRAFLMYNTKFEIILFAHYLHLLHAEVFKNMSLCYKNFGGNLWLRKI